MAYGWARPVILVAGKGRGGMFLFLLFLHFHSCSSFFLSLSFVSSTVSSISFLPFSGRRHKMTRKGWCVVKPQHNQKSFCDPLLRLFKPSLFVRKHGRLGAVLNFPIYLYRKLLSESHWTDFSVIRQECSYGDPLPRLFEPSWFVKKKKKKKKKNVIARCQGLFSLYIYIEEIKIFLSEKYWTDFNITGQKCFFSDPHQECSSHHDSSINMAARGGAYFSYISI